ncbi:MAG TPA: RHS repeat-associated core domain-containing protein [Anaerolineae bacterium]|nr:RHS repeat-associated core domain-containing protein [Anaerolineae bacterium]HQK14018.1 RHS repeat-associated core domain-containing protein [Anaerolineae bacterium]
MNGYVPTSTSLFHAVTQYDALGRGTQVTAPDGTISHTLYSGWQTTVIDANNHQRISTIDATVTQFTYDGDGNRVQQAVYRNLAAGRTPTAASGVTVNQPQAATNGDPWADSGSGSSGEFAYTSVNGLQYIQIDLGAVYSVDTVRVWHYAADGRTYYNTKTQVSADGSTWFTVFDSATQGTYAETAQGKTHRFTARSVRYVRDYTNGSTANAGNHWVEIAVWGTAVSSTTYVGNHFEWTGSTSTMVKYYYADSQRVAMRQGSSTLYFLLGDHLGSTSITANSSGSKVAELRYHPWGGTRYTDGTTPTTRRFTGQIEDAAIGLYFYNARSYDPSLGRFIQADTMVPSPVNPQTLNRYAYTLNNPVKYTDPSGHCIFGVDTAICIAAVVGGAVNLAVDYLITTQVMHEEYSFGRGVVAFGTGAVGTLIGGAVIPKVAQSVGAAVALKVAASTASETAGILAGAATQVGTDMALSGISNIAFNSAQRIGQKWVDGGQISGQMVVDDLRQNANTDFVWGAGSSFIGQTTQFLSDAYLPNPNKGGDIILAPGRHGLSPTAVPFSGGLTRNGQRALAIRSGYQMLTQVLSDTSTLELMDTILPSGRPAGSPLPY